MSIDTALKGHDLFQSLSVDETNQISSFFIGKEIRL